VIAEAAELDRGAVTQDGVARVFARRQAGQLAYDHNLRAWFEWTGTHWRRDSTDRAFQFARELGREFSEGAKDRDLKEVRRVTFAAGVERFARSDPALAVTSDGWDADPFLLGTPGGAVDLRTGLLRTAEPRERITKLTSVAPIRKVSCPRWRAFLVEATGDDQELVRFLQQWAGCCLSGDTREHSLVFIYGGGGNGKSVFLNVLTGILADYATVAAMDTFVASRWDRHSTELAMLHGARLVTSSETTEGRAWDEAKVKQLTGGDPITARFMRQDNFTFRPAFKLTIVGNHRPVLRNIDDATRRRFNIVPFTRKPRDPDPLLEEKLKGEWPAILQWMIEGALDWQANGLVRPASVLAATEDYFAAQDVFAHWLDEACNFEPGNEHKWEAGSSLFASWRAFAERAGESTGTQKAFTDQMRRRGCEPHRTGIARGFRGIRLKLTRSFHDDGCDG
jgi:putative DNA primase/helicase